MSATPFNVLAGTVSTAAPAARMRAFSAVVAVTLIHAVLIAVIMRASEHTVPPYAIQSHVIRAQLLSPAPAPAAPSVLRSSPTPAPAPQPIVKKHAQPRVRQPAPTHAVAPAAPAQPAAPTPSVASQPSKPEPAEAVAASSASDVSSHSGAPASPAAGRETLAISAPKDVHHIDCSIVKPDYPALSSRRGEEGTANVKFVIGVTGAIENIELAKTSGYPRLDEAALAAMRASSCHPYTENGVPIRAAYTKPFTFVFGD